MRVGTRIGAKSGKVWQAGKQSHEQQRHGRDAERVEHLPVPVSTRGHHPDIAKTMPKCCQTMSGLESMQWRSKKGENSNPG